MSERSDTISAHFEMKKKIIKKSFKDLYTHLYI